MATPSPTAAQRSEPPSSVVVPLTFLFWSVDEAGYLVAGDAGVPVSLDAAGYVVLSTDPGAVTPLRTLLHGNEIGFI